MSHRPDEPVARDSGAGFTAHSEGQFAAACVDVVDLGINVEQFPGQEPREVAKVALVFATGERQESDKSLVLVTTEMTNSANEKANLRKFLEAWRGRSYTSDQVAAGLPIAKLWKQSALLSIEHVPTKKGRTFAKITSIAPLPKAMLESAGETLGNLPLEYERPKFLVDRKAQYAETLKRHRANGDFPEPTPPGDDDDSDSDLPF